MFYFGCESANRKGHFFFKQGMQTWNLSDRDKQIWRTLLANKIDGGFCPDTSPIYQEQGKAKLTHIEGLTVLAFWDRSADPRGGCNSAFIKEGAYTFSEMLVEAKEVFPNIFERFNFEVVEL